MTHVLVVDDSETIRQFVRLALEPQGYQVSEAADGDEGLAAIRAETEPSIVLLDFQMPRMNGDKVLHIVDTEGGQLSTHEYIVITGAQSSFPDEFIELLRRLSIRVLPKPFRDVDLMPVVEGAQVRLTTGPEEPLPDLPPV